MFRFAVLIVKEKREKESIETGGVGCRQGGTE